MILSVLALSAAPARDRKPKAEKFALVAGTVFRETGFALRGARIILEPRPEGDGKGVKVKKTEVQSDARGEFAIRVPPIPMRYTVAILAAGFKTERKEVTIQGEERVDLFIRLDPESK